MKRILIDTDVILDIFFDRQPFSHSAARVLAFCESGKTIGYVTPVIISNLYYLLRRVASHQKVIEKLTLLMSTLEVLTIDKDVIQHALRSEFKDFEDALQSYSAEKNGNIEMIITRNLKDYKNSSIAVMSPDYFIKLMVGARS